LSLYNIKRSKRIQSCRGFIFRNRRKIYAPMTFLSAQNDEYNFMKNLILKFLNKHDSRSNLACGILILLAMVLGCSDSGNSEPEAPKKPTPPAYVGVWTGADGSTVTIRNDGSGDYKSGGKSVSGATVEIDEAAKEIRFSLLGFDSGKYKIDQTPAKNRMKLDGMDYRRTGGFDASDSGMTSNDSSSEVPTEDELRPIVAETVKSFNDAVRQEDFSDFYASISESWQSQITAEQMAQAFSPLFKKNLNFTPKNETSINFSPKPAFQDDNSLKVEINYLTVKGTSVKFRLRYVKEGDDWKLLGILLNPPLIDK
jgi:hypothetical protein